MISCPKEKMLAAMILPIVFQLVLIAAATSCCAEPPARPAEGNQPLWLERQGKRVFLLGANYPWYNGFRGLDLGRLRGTKTIAGVAFWNGRDLQSPLQPLAPGVTGFDPAGIEAQFSDMHAIGIHALRWILVCDDRAFLELDRQGNCTGIDLESLRSLDAALALAAKHRIFLAPCLLDFRFVTGDEHVRYSDGTSGESHADVIRTPQKRKLLVEKFVKPLVMTEGTAAMKTHLDYYVTSAFEGGWAGYFPWTYYRLVGLNDLIRYPRIVTSKDKGEAAGANLEFYRKFNREHAAALSLP